MEFPRLHPLLGSQAAEAGLLLDLVALPPAVMALLEEVSHT